MIEPCVAGAPRSDCIIAEWKSFIDREQGRAPRAELDDVNAELNKIIYRLDPYYWETPREFAVHEGDCKDYAIAKYFTLRKLGWRADDLRVVVLRDMDLVEDHAITVAYLDGNELLARQSRADGITDRGDSSLSTLLFDQ